MSFDKQKQIEPAVTVEIKSGGVAGTSAERREQRATKNQPIDVGMSIQRDADAQAAARADALWHFQDCVRPREKGEDWNAYYRQRVTSEGFSTEKFVDVLANIKPVACLEPSDRNAYHGDISVVMPHGYGAFVDLKPKELNGDWLADRAKSIAYLENLSVRTRLLFKHIV